MQTIKLLGISASPRKHGNSEYLLNQALTAAAEEFPVKVESEAYLFTKKKMSGCIACFKCVEKGDCIVKDDFHELRDKWFEADAIIYSVPVYHMGIPSQLKAFIDRLGNTLALRFWDTGGFPRHLKTVGVLTQGGHLCAGQEQVMNYIITHSVLMRCVPVAGDPWQSYIGAGGWCRNVELEIDGFKRFHEAGEEDSQVTVTAAKSVVRRVIETAMILKAGGVACQKDLAKDAIYSPFLNRAGIGV
jgi:multimeric flavodoxin WrbA